MATYYVKNIGNNANTGLSDAQAWQTIAKVTAAAIQPGDTVLFKRGDTWKQVYLSASYVGTLGNQITFGAYGTGAKPKLLGSVTVNSGWSDQGSNIWQNSDAAFATEVGNLVFNSEESCGVRVILEESLAAQGNFWYDSTNKLVKLYSASDPATFYSNIEACLKKNIVNINLKSYWTVRDLDIRYGAGNGIGGTNPFGIEIYDCDISYIGGGYLTGTVRYGNGIEFYEAAHDNIAERCKVSNCYDVAFTSQGSTSSHQAYNIFFRNNICYNNEWSFELYCRPANAYCHHVYFENNTCLNAGGGWSHAQRPDATTGCHVIMINFTSTKDNIFVQNNIFHTWTDYAVRYTPLANVEGVTVDYNLYYGVVDIANVDGTLYDYITEWEAYKTASGKDAHSIQANPLFKDLSNKDYHVSGNSPTIQKGLDVGILTDFDGRKVINPPTIGAFTAYKSTKAFFLLNQ